MEIAFIICSFLLSSITFLLAFIKYAPANESDLVYISGKISDLEYSSYNRSYNRITFFCNGIKYEYVIPDNDAKKAKEKYEDFNNYVAYHNDNSIVIKVIKGTNLIAEITYGDNCFSLDDTNSFIKERQRGLIIGGVTFLIFAIGYIFLIIL